MNKKRCKALLPLVQLLPAVAAAAAVLFALPRTVPVLAAVPERLTAVVEHAVVIFHILSPLLFRGCGVSCKASLVYDTLLSLVNGQSARFAEKRLLSCIWGRMPSRPVQQKRAPAPAGADAL